MGKEKTLSRLRNTPKRGLQFYERKTPLTCGAPLRNRTVDLLITMYACLVPSPQVDGLSCENTSADRRSYAPDRPTRTPSATQSATHFDLSSEQLAAAGASLRPRVRSVVDQYRRVQSHRLSSGGTASACLPPARRAALTWNIAGSSSQRHGRSLPPATCPGGEQKPTVLQSTHAVPLMPLKKAGGSSPVNPAIRN